VQTVSCVQDTTKVSTTGELLVPVVWHCEQLPLALRRFVVDPGTGCWLWQGPPNVSGHGQLYTPNGTTTAHRAVYEALIGPLNTGIALHHTCPNRLCVNPLHVQPMLLGEHTTHHVQKRRESGLPTIGGQGPRRRLSAEERATIHDLYLSRWGTMQEIADLVRCSRQTVHNILRKSSQAHISQPAGGAQPRQHETETPFAGLVQVAPSPALAPVAGAGLGGGR